MESANLLIADYLFVGLVTFLFCREAMGKILARGHSRVPVYSGNPRNVIGLLLVGVRNCVLLSFQ